MAKCDCGSVPRHIWGRRDFIKVGSLGILGLNLRDYFFLRSASAGTAPVDRSVILVWLSGGPPHHDTFDMKPDAPAEIRGTFKPIPTNVPGIQVCEHLPRTARQAHKFAVIRSMTSRENNHEPAINYLLTGYLPLRSEERRVGKEWNDRGRASCRKKIKVECVVCGGSKRADSC